MISSSSASVKKRRVLIGVGGASNSGKTTLAKHLHRLLKNSTIIHLDDFAPPQSDIPYSPLYPDLQDWDTPATALEWPLLRSTIAHFKETGQLPDEHRSHDAMNKASDTGTGSFEDTALQLVKDVEAWEKELGEEVEWAILDGFLLFWDPEVLAQLDLRIFLRVPYQTLKTRREARQVYVTQTGEIWTDPPNYFDQIVYPAYVLAHTSIFTTPSTAHLSPEERVETCPPSPSWTKPRKEGGEGLLVIEPKIGDEGMGEALVKVLEGLRECCLEL
ncbi:P-loop containing nucleoside triphosphate hydrolase protein [Mrakia frigida]|uniref:ribosylnicotinamide kinase n=1 Tax=Mrakia frigida TaxID=29902 RepID=UPI003FCC0D24